MNPFLSHRIIKKLTILIFCTSIFLLTGCWDRREINDTAVVLAAAIDKGENNTIKVTVQILIPKAVSSGQSGPDQGGTRIMIRSAVGENMADAVSKLQLVIARKLFWGHCKAFIFGEQLAKEGGIREQTDYLLRHPEPREHAYLFVSFRAASDFIENETTLERYLGEGLRKIAEMHLGIRTTLIDFQQMLTNDTEAVLLPLVNTSPQQQGMKKKIDLVAGTAIFKKDRMIGQIDPNVTRGMLWLRNEVEITAVTVNAKDGGKISLDPLYEKTQLIPTIQNGKWSVLAKIQSEGTIVQNGSTLDIMNPTIMKEVEDNFEKDIKERINQSLIQVKDNMNVDAFGFADAFHRKYPSEWEKVKDHWDEILPQVEVTIQINVQIRRPGLINEPAGLKKNEVEEK